MTGPRQPLRGPAGPSLRPAPSPDGFAYFHFQATNQPAQFGAALIFAQQMDEGHRKFLAASLREIVASHGIVTR
jgi:hypothetical protein